GGEVCSKGAEEGRIGWGLRGTVGGLLSLALQYGVPLEALVSKFGHVRFEPSGFTKNPEIPYAKSLTDYIFRFLGMRFLSTEQKQEASLVEANEQKETLSGNGDNSLQPPVGDAPEGKSLYKVAANQNHFMSAADTQAQVFHISPGATWQSQADAPSCADCGSIMIRNGSCYKCLNCGATSGCS